MFKRLFLDHPQDVDESYLEHMGFALRFSGLLLLAAAAALVHALIPALCTKTASRIIAQLHAKTAHRGAPSPTPAE